MRKFFIALIAMFALTFAAVTLASVSPTKQKADAVAQVSIEKSAVTTQSVELRTSIDSAEASRAPAVCDVATIDHRLTLSGARPLKPDKRIDYGNRITSDSHGHRQTARVLTP